MCSHLRSDSARQVFLGKMTVPSSRAQVSKFQQWYSLFPPVCRGCLLALGFTRIFVCEVYVARILHAELSSNVLMASVQLRHFLPGQPRELAHPGSLGGYQLLLEWVSFRLILIYTSLLKFFQGEKSTERPLHAVT